MAVGDEFGLTEDLYQKLIGRYVAAIEVLTQRLVAKDQHIARIETENAKLEAEAFKLQTAEASKAAEEGDLLVIAENESPTLVKRPKGKR